MFGIGTKTVRNISLGLGAVLLAGAFALALRYGAPEAAPAKPPVAHPLEARGETHG